MEKILRTIESLKVPSLSSSTDANVPGSITSAVVAASDSVKTKKKERISHCIGVTDAVCTPSVQNLADFPTLLESVSEVLFQLCNDQDSDIRLVATDCLNRIARTLKDQLSHRVQMEVYKEIKRNQNPRSLRLALSLFAHMSSLIRPQKCRVFMQTLLPCFSQISKRTEELLYENLPASYLQIFKNLGPFLSDAEIKMLFKEYLRNLESNSAIVRRSSATILVYICQYSRKPHIFLPRLLSYVTELLMPNLMEKSVSIIIGALLCVRQCIPPLYEELRNQVPNHGVVDQENVLKHLIQVYEMCLILCNHDDHNVITTSLETLQQLLTSPVDILAQRLTSADGIKNSFDLENWKLRVLDSGVTVKSVSQHSQWQPSFGSVFSDDPASLLLEGDSDVPKFRGLTSSSTSEPKEEFDIDVSISSSRRNSDIFILATASENELGSRSSTEVLQESGDDTFHDNSDNTLVIENYPELQIGSLYEENIPLYYCTRFLTYNFLLAGRKGYERPDSEIRVTVKVLAINCITNAMKLCPEIFHLPLSVLTDGNEEPEELQTIEDICLLSKHHDPLLRGSLFILIGQLVRRVLEVNLGTFTSYPIRLENLVSVLKVGLQDTSNVGVKYAIAGVKNCIVPLWRSEKGSEQANSLFTCLFESISNAYWLVKVDLVDLLSTIEWDAVQNRRQAQSQVRNLLLEFLTDEDIRVRTATVLALVKFVEQCGKCEDWTMGKLQVFSHVTIIEEVGSDIFQLSEARSMNPNLSICLEKVLNKITTILVGLDARHSFAGFYSALASFSEKFSPRVYKRAWRCDGPEIPALLAVTIDLLRSSPVVTDLFVHQNILTLATNLFLGIVNKDDSEEPDPASPFIEASGVLSKYGLQLLQYSYALVKLYHSTVESNSHLGQGGHKKNSPVLSPVKKLGSKSDSEKKDTDTEKKNKSQQQQLLNPQGNNNVCAVQLKRVSDVLQQQWKIFRSSLDPIISHKFTCVLVTSLNTLGHVCSCLRPDYVGLTSMFEDILIIAPTIFYITPIPTLRCIRKILRCLYLQNPPALVDESHLLSSADPVSQFQEFTESFYKSLIASRKSGTYQSPSDKSSLGGYIRSFEPIVITSLRIYTTSSDVAVQTEILALLSDLIKGHVNYAMVDSSQIFLGFVIKQIGFLEEGHIRNPSELVNSMFEFFTLLSHEQHTKKFLQFIDVPKMLRLCDGLVASGQNPVTHCIPGLKRVVYDLFIRRGYFGVTNLEKIDLEAQREVLFQIIIKLANVPEILPVLLVLLQGRRATNESKWAAESVTIASTLVYAVEKGLLLIQNSTQFQCIAAILSSISPHAIPPFERLKSLLQEAVSVPNEDIHSFIRWSVQVNTFWLLMLRSAVCNRESCVSGTLMLELLRKRVADFQKILADPTRTDSSYNQFCVEQLVSFFQMVTFLFRQNLDQEIIPQVDSEEQLPILCKIAGHVVAITVLHPAIRSHFLDFLTVLSYPYAEVWSLATSSWQAEDLRRGLRSNLVSSILKELVSSLFGIQVREFRSIDFEDKNALPFLETWVIENHTDCIIQHSQSQVVTSFLNRINNDSRDLLMKQILGMNTAKLDPMQIKSILCLLGKLYEYYKSQTIIFCLKLLTADNIAYVSFELAQFICFVFSQLEGATFSEEDTVPIKRFVASPANRLRFPRLASLAMRVIIPEEDNANDSEPPSPSLTDLYERSSETPILLWCCDEISSSEGIALAKMLSTLTYTQLMNVFNQSTFNSSLLKHVFRHLYDQFLTEAVSVEDVFSLFTNEKHSVLVEKLPLGVAAFDFIVETLDKWEGLIPEILVTVSDDSENDSVLSIPFGNKLINMWAALTELLNLKKTVFQSKSVEDKIQYNNYIPTKIFTFSFQYMRALCSRKDELQTIPLSHLHGFLNFASVAVCDPSFLHFFNVRDQPAYIFKCIFALGSILKGIVSKFKISYISTQMEETWSDLNEGCVRVLKEFQYLADFICQARHGKISVESTLLDSLKNVVAGLARCELVNGWILISHLEWKPISATKSQIFPPIQHIPLEILQNEKDLLLKYIFKLNLFGIASKIQFEENWMTFLSVINSYGDEHYQLQVIIVGLQALSMMLEKCVRVVYKQELTAQKVASGLRKIDHVLQDLEPDICRAHQLPPLYPKCTKTLENEFRVDVTSCIRFLIDLFSQWLQNVQGKMPLLLISKVVESIVNISEYFDDPLHYGWMYEILMDIYKSSEREDDILWPHLVYGIFVSAAKIALEPEALVTLGQILESSLTNGSINVANATLRSVLVYFQNVPDCLPLLNIVQPFVLANTQLKETLGDSECHSYNVWKILLFTWIYGPSDGVGGTDFEQEVLGNILTVLSPLNKVNVSIRLLVLQSLKVRVRLGGLRPETKRKITKVALETMRTPNMAIFFESVKLFVTIFYCDFAELFEVPDTEPEVLMQMAERSEVLFQLLRRGRVFNCKVISRVVPVIVMDFLPPSEILNRVIAEFLSPTQTSPELLAPTIAQIFEKARRRPKEAALVREWISAGLPNFVAVPDVSRTMWNLTLFFVGVSTTPEVANLLPFAELRRNATQIKKLFIHSALDYYSTLNDSEKEYFQTVFRKSAVEQSERDPFGFLIDLIQNPDNVSSKED